MQGAGLDHLFQLSAQAHNLSVDGAPVCFDLSFARPPDKAQTASLTFQVGPGAYQPGALIAERGHFNLQHPFAGPRAIRKDFQDQPGSIQQFDLPGAFQIALLNRCHWSIHQHQFNLIVMKDRTQFINLATAEQQPRARLWQRHDFRADHFKIGQSRCKRDRFFQSGRGSAPVFVGFYIRMQHPGSGAHPVMGHQEASSPS